VKNLAKLLHSCGSENQVSIKLSQPQKAIAVDSILQCRAISSSSVHHLQYRSAQKNSKWPPTI